MPLVAALALGCSLLGHRGIQTAVENRASSAIVVGVREDAGDSFFLVRPLEVVAVDTVGDANVPAETVTIYTVECQPKASLGAVFDTGGLIVVTDVAAEPTFTRGRSATVRNPKPEDTGAGSCEEAAAGDEARPSEPLPLTRRGSAPPTRR
jgi:hypothetical protein